MDCTDPSNKDHDGDENGSINGVTERFRFVQRSKWRETEIYLPFSCPRCVGLHLALDFSIDAIRSHLCQKPSADENHTRDEKLQFRGI